MAEFPFIESNHHHHVLHTFMVHGHDRSTLMVHLPLILLSTNLNLDLHLQIPISYGLVCIQSTTGSIECALDVKEPPQ